MRGGLRTMFICPSTTFEARLFDAHGTMLQIYRVDAQTVADALIKLGAAQDISCARFELWRGMIKLAEGELRRDSMRP